MNRGKLIAVVLAISLLANLALAVQYSAQRKQLAVAEATIAQRSYDAKALAFAKLFVDKVLKAQDEISFETRLQLENAVRDLKDQAIIDRWNAFVNAATESEAQSAVKELLSSLVDKIRG